jgi:O-acetylhomoserine/O-acetylserine sulfhydrylase-like pyridoxal-dependent enzyme
LQIHSKAVHAGDRKKLGPHIPTTTPIYTASSYVYDHGAARPHLRQEETGPCYARYDNPSASALEELVSSLENGHGALACASGMAAIHMAVLAALTDRRKSVVAPTPLTAPP